MLKIPNVELVKGELCSEYYVFHKTPEDYYFTIHVSHIHEMTIAWMSDRDGVAQEFQESGLEGLKRRFHLPQDAYISNDGRLILALEHSVDMEKVVLQIATQ